MKARRLTAVMVAVLVVAVAALAAGWWQTRTAEPEPAGSPTTATTTVTSERGVTVVVSQPVGGASVASPLQVRGRVPGTWTFEASFGVEVLDASGASIGQAAAQVIGDWMTTELVAFEATIEFPVPAHGSGTLVLHNANAAGDPAHDDRVEIPVQFG